MKCTDLKYTVWWVLTNVQSCNSHHNADTEICHHLEKFPLVLSRSWSDLCLYSFVVVQLYLTLCDPWTAAHPVSLSFTISQSLFKFMSIESVMSSSHLNLCPFLLRPSIFPSNLQSTYSIVLPFPKYHIKWTEAHGLWSILIFLKSSWRWNWI